MWNSSVLVTGSHSVTAGRSIAVRPQLINQFPLLMGATRPVEPMTALNESL